MCGSFTFFLFSMLNYPSLDGKLAEKFGRLEKMLYLCIRFSCLLSGNRLSGDPKLLIQNELQIV